MLFLHSSISVSTFSIYFKHALCLGRTPLAVCIDHVWSHDIKTPVQVACLLQKPMDRAVLACRTTPNNIDLSREEVYHVVLSLLLLRPRGERSIAISLSVCLCVCLSASISLEPLDRSSRNLLCGSPVEVARSSFGGVAICYVLPVLWMTSRLAVMGRMSMRGRRYDTGAESGVCECFVVIVNSGFQCFTHYVVLLPHPDWIASYTWVSPP